MRVTTARRAHSERGPLLTVAEQNVMLGTDHSPSLATVHSRTDEDRQTGDAIKTHLLPQYIRTGSPLSAH